MPLTHVCMWINNHWEHVSADQAAKMHPGGTVPAHSGLFMCELCGQYVSLVNSKIQEPHFRHNASEKSKNCPERSSGLAYQIHHNPQEHELPIRIITDETKDETSKSFRFELGIVRAPISNLSKDLRIEITPVGLSKPYVYSKERLQEDCTTYLSIGEQPFEKYILHIENGSENLREFWPEEIQGINPEGTIFDQSSGRKLPDDADIKINKSYYLLKCHPADLRANDSIRIKKITQRNFGNVVWTLYTVSAIKFDEDAASFFLGFHCRLTDQPISMTPVWPLFVGDNDTIKHNQKTTYMLVRGNAVFHNFPKTAMPYTQIDNQSKLYEIPCTDRQQLFTASRTRTLQSAYIWKEPLLQEGKKPEISVTDPSASEIVPGNADTLPYKKTLRFQSSCAGEIVVSKNDRIVDRRKLSVNNQLELNHLSYGTNIQVVIGLDIIWEISFKRNKVHSSDEDELLKKLRSRTGSLIPAPHTLRNILVSMRHYPKICQWIKNCIHAGTISEQSYRILQNTYLSMNRNKQES